MKKLRILLVIIGIGVMIKLGLYHACKTTDKGVTNHSSTLAESKSNDFFLESYQLIEVGDEDKHELGKKLNLEAIYLEKRWDYKCAFWGFGKIPTKINGQNILLAIKVENLESLDNYRFYLVNESDTIILRGNRTKETTYYNKSFNTFKNLADRELILANMNGKLAARFKLKKEKN